MRPIFEKIPIGAAQTIVAFQYAKKDFETPWHFHPQHELTYIEQSVGTKFIGDYVGVYESGELVLLRSNLPHCWKNQVMKEGISQSIVVQWDKETFAIVPELQPIFDMLRKADKGIIFDKVDQQKLVPIIKSLPLLEKESLYLQLLLLLTQLTKCNYRTLSTASFTTDIPSLYGNRMSKVYDFVALNYQRKIYLKELAVLVNMTEQSFSRFFKKMMGRSFFTFLNEYRINRASRMLIDTDYSVGEIGYACGFESLPFFHKQFNKFKKKTPLKLRKQFMSS